MPPKTICHACKKRQRGCVWSTKTANICVRCTKLNLKCIPSEQVINDPNDDDVLPKEFVRKAIDYWKHQINQLEHGMQQMEDDAHCLSKKVKRQNKNDHDSNVKYENRVHDATQAMAIYKSLVSTTATTTEGQQKQPFGWELTIKDGLLELNSDIDTIEELLQYSNSFIKHLSPFRGVFQKSSIYLETTSFNLLIRTFRFIFLSIENLASKRSSQQCNLLSVPQQQQQQHQHNYHHYVQREHQQQISIQHPSIPYLHLHYRSIVDHLIHIYSNHENSRRLFLHVPTFLNYYQHLQDPLTCPITLAVCVHTLCTARRMITHSASERRAIANFFYDKCKDILYDIFDDPDYKLETIIVINLLQHFVMFVLLRFNEARRWITIAHCLCKNLESNNMTDEGVTQPHHQHQPKKCQQLTLYLPSDIKHALLQRHIFYTENTYQLLDFIVDETASGPHPRKMNSMKVSYMQSIPGEDRGTCEMIEAHNRLLQLCTNPYMAAISTHNEKLGGAPDNIEISMDILVRLDSVIREWWNDLPGYLRICDDLHSEDAMDAIKANKSVSKALIFSFIHSILMKIDTCVLNIINVAGIEEEIEESSISYDEKILLYNRAKSDVKIRSCELLLSTITSIISSDKDILAFLFEFFSRAVYAMLNICYNLREEYYSSNLREKFIECFDTIYDVFPNDNVIPTTASPLNLFVWTQQMTEFDIYIRYPLPGYTVLADIVNACRSYTRLASLESLQEPLATWLSSYTRAPLYGNFYFME